MLPPQATVHEGDITKRSCTIRMRMRKKVGERRILVREEGIINNILRSSSTYLLSLLETQTGNTPNFLDNLNLGLGIE